MLTWLAETAIGIFFKQLFGALREAFNDWLASQNARDAGRAEANAEHAERASQVDKEGSLAEAEARQDHANADTSKDTDAGLDTDFRRRDE